MENKHLTTNYTDVDGILDSSLRPKTLNDFIGQDKLKENLKVYIQACKARRESLDHVLLYGPPGLGKTTLAHIIANELGVDLKVTSGPGIERAANLASVLTNLGENDVLFLDEIHRLNRSVEEILYPAMEDFALDISTGKGAGATSIRLNLNHFTLVGATTRAGMLTGPLRDRFGVICRLEMYEPEQLSKIVKRSALIMDIAIENDAALEIARRSRGTPRIANRLLKRIRDFAEVFSDGAIDIAITKRALTNLEIDENGLDANDKRFLSTIIEKFAGGPVGVDTIATSLNEEPVTIEDVVEPYLIQQGFVARTSRGRVALPRAYEYLNLKIPQSNIDQLDMFKLIKDADDE